jgi:cytochrome c oxidase cbb3-type subunit IV
MKGSAAMAWDYHMLRAFADSWGLLAMMAFFVAAVAIALRPSAKDSHQEAAAIPFKEEE